MNNDVIVIRQLPIITEQLQTIKSDVTEKVNTALSLVCSEDTVKEVKTARSELNKEFKEWEEKRKQVKTAIMSPYEQFELVYKDCITNTFKTADIKLKSKIDYVENELKDQKRKEVEEYFNEYLASKDIDFVTFDNANINITLSASLKSLKDQAKAFVDRIHSDLELISTQEYSQEIRYEYNKNGFNVSAAITTVVNRYKAIKEAIAREEERKAKELAKAEVEKKVDEIVSQTAEVEKNQPLAPPTVEENDPVLTIAFRVRGTKAQLKKLKEFLIANNYDFE